MPNNTHHPYSPSVLCRRAHCPASRRIEANLPDQPSEAAESGTRIHQAIADWIRAGRPEDLGAPLADNTEQALYEYCCAYILHIGDKALEIEAERPLELTDIYGGVLTRGTADAVFRIGEQWHIVDWKTGRGEIDDAESNWQGAAYAAMLAQEKWLENVCVAFVQPALDRSTSHVFGSDELLSVYQKIIDCVANGESQSPKREAGRWCQYCKGRLANVCNLYRYRVEESLLVPDEYEPGHMAEDVLAREYERARVAAEYADALKQEIQRRCRERGEACGYTLRSKPGARQITDAQGAFVRLSERMQMADYLKCVSVSIGDLERAYWEAQRAARPADKVTLKAAKAEMEEALGGIIQRKPETLTLTRVKEANNGEN